MYQKKKERTLTEAVERMLEQFTSDLVHKHKISIDELDIAQKAFKESNIYKNTLALTNETTRKVKQGNDLLSIRNKDIERLLKMVDMYQHLAEDYYVNSHVINQCDEGDSHVTPR